MEQDFLVLEKKNDPEEINFMLFHSTTDFQGKILRLEENEISIVENIIPILTKVYS